MDLENSVQKPQKKKWGMYCLPWRKGESEKFCEDYEKRRHIFDVHGITLKKSSLAARKEDGRKKIE